MPDRPLKLGVLGGALHSAIGRTHHIACQMDGRFQIAAGCFSIHTEQNQATAQALGLPADRCHVDWRGMLAAEQNQLDAILVLTPTPIHTEMVTTAMAMGHRVICEKALASSVDDARRIRQAKHEHQGYLAVTYNYTGYPMVRELREIVANGHLGDILHVHVEMPQEGFLRLGRDDGKPQPQDWRLKDGVIPTVSLDLGGHVHQLIHFLTGATPQEVVCMEQSLGHFAGLVDNVQCLARYSGELDVHLWYGKTALGHSNGLKLRLYGSRGSAAWYQMDPEYLDLHDNRGHAQRISRSSNMVSVSHLDRYNRFKAGHPSGFIEAFANLYYDIADHIEAHLRGDTRPHPMVAGVTVAEEGLSMLDAMHASACSHAWQIVSPPED